jgi:hypothetical protein
VTVTVTVDSILDRVNGVRRTRRGWTARCPAHRDRSPSLSIAEGNDGRALLYCHAGCSFDEIASALNFEGSTTTTRTAAQSPRALALQLARRQPGHRHRLRYQIADTLRTVDRARRLAGRGGDREEVWCLLARIARIETEALRIETHLEEVAA